MVRPSAEIRFEPIKAPVTLNPVAADVIVEDTTDRPKVVSEDMKTMLSDAVAVKRVDDSSETPMLVALAWNRTLRIPLRPEPSLLRQPW